MGTVVFEHSASAGSARLGQTLRDFGHRLHVVRLHEGDHVPPDLDDVDAVVTCGGASSCNDGSLEWLEPELAFLRDAHETGRPVVGICLGSQLLARALGGTVEPMSGGIEAGWHAVSLTPAGREDPLHAGIAWTSIQPHWHREEVSALPDGARVIASSERCTNQVWAIGLRTYGFQYHPEIDEHALERWAGEDPDGLRESGLTVEQLRQQTAEHYPACARLTQRLFEAIALLLMPTDRRYTGLVKDLHH
ncbi:MAG: type 1 glutamine amidotransferase [Planctomycetota bacterium]|jgi:GMP synthase (glutamine-hydrolysing)